MDENSLFLRDSASVFLEKCQESVDTQDLKLACRYEHLLEECVKRCILDKAQCKQFATLQNRLSKLVSDWKMALVKGDNIEVYHGNTWYAAKVTSEKVDDGQVKVHYTGWSGNDEFISLVEKRVQPSGCLIVKDNTKRGRSAPQSVTEEAAVAEPKIDSAQEEAPGDEELLLGANGRPVRRARGSVAKSAPAPQNTEKQSKERVVRTKKTTAEISDENFDSFCSLCGLRENSCALDPLMCEGSCLRIFHRECLDLSTEPEHWYCDQCSTRRHTCFLCGVLGKDYSEVFKCSLAACGKYFHPQCLEGSGLAHFEMKKGDKELTGNEKALYEKQHDLPASSNPSIVVSSLNIRCPRHYCDTCFGEYGNVSDLLFKCMMCSRAFHDKCRPPGYRFLGNILICTQHPDAIMPPICMTKPRFVQDKTIAKFWQTLKVPDLYSEFKNNKSQNAKIDDITFFCLPQSFRTEIASLPPIYTKITYNDYSFFPLSKLPAHASPAEPCECLEVCDERCFNFQMRVECAPKWCAVNCAENRCLNRRLQQHKYAKTEVFREGLMGWGLKTKQAVDKGDLVVEYIGEVINETEMHKRLQDQATLSPQDKDFYVMELDDGVYVDGKKKANDSRFINHSCDPNCQLQRWNVKGAMRIAIVAIKDIAEGESLSYDYQFDTQEANAFKCYCGASRCRGTMAPRKRDYHTMQALGSNDAQVRNKFLREAKQVERKNTTVEVLREEEWSRSYTDSFLPGDTICDIKSGPTKGNFNFVRRQGCFMLRSVAQGQNITKRRKLHAKDWADGKKDKTPLDTKRK